MRIARNVLVLALVAGLPAGYSIARQAGSGQRPETTAAASPDRSVTDAPVRRITLFRSGVASFERRALVNGTQSLRLQFRDELLNDVLKSLVGLDTSGRGGVRSVAFDSGVPLQKRLETYGVDLQNDAPLVDILRSLRGSALTVRLAGETVHGTILGTESRMVEAEREGHMRTEPFVNLVTDAGIRSIALYDAQSVTLSDARLQAEMTRALADLASQRVRQSRGVEVLFAGEGEREVAVMYTHEAPVWKATYRLLMDDSDRPTLSGWAIVENTTDEDWDQIRLSLVSGRPVSFVMDLQQPLFVTRPVLPVPSAAGLLPRVHAEALSIEGRLREESAQNKSLRQRLTTANRQQSLEFAPSAAPATAAADAPRDEWTALAGSMTSGADATLAGEQFRFDISSPISIARQSSAMLPIISAPLTARRVSILTGPLDGRTAHPMRGVELTNSTDLQVLPGPIAVFDHGVHAGDATTEQINPGDTRFVSYASDLDVVAGSESTQESGTVRVRLVRGVFEQSVKDTRRTTYTVRNKSISAPRTVIIEHPRLPGYGLAPELKPTSTTASHHRFEVTLKPAEHTAFVVTQETSRSTQLAAIDAVNGGLADATLVAWQSEGKVSQEVVNAFREIASRRTEIVRMERRRADLDAQWARLSADQERTRQNMMAVDRNSELYARYVKKLGDLETEGEKIGAENIELTARWRQAQSDLEAFVGSLTLD